MKKLLLLFPFIIVLISSCGSSQLLPFTQEFRKENRLTPHELKSLQFYTSHDIILRRGSRQTKKSEHTGMLKINDSKLIEEIILPAGTPCVVEHVTGPDQLALRFSGRHDEFLVFGSLHEDRGYYELKALEWRKGRGKVAYGGKYYYSDPGSRHCILLVRAKHVKTLVYQRRVVNGQTLTERK